jgi:hypothetical protein
MILTKNQKGKTPLDLAIDSNAPKTAEIYLAYLRKINHFNLSKVFYQRFGDLFDFEIASFDEFMNDCFFTTRQMQMCKRYKMDDDPIIFGSPSCLLDEKTMTNFGIKKSETEELKIGQVNFDEIKEEDENEDSEVLSDKQESLYSENSDDEQIIEDQK